MYIPNSTFSKYSKVVCTQASPYVVLFKTNSIGGTATELAGRSLTSWEYTITDADKQSNYLMIMAVGNGYGYIHLEGLQS